MKNNKFNLIVLLALTLSFFVGCGNNDKIGHGVPRPPIRVTDVDGYNHVAAIKSELSRARAVLDSGREVYDDSLEQEYYYIYRDNNVKDIKDFYSLERFEFANCELVAVDIFDHSFSYWYTPKAKLNSEVVNWASMDLSSSFRIILYQSGFERKPTIERLKVNAAHYEAKLTEDGFMYYPSNILYAPLGNTTLEIRAPHNTSPEASEYVLEQWHKMRDQMSEEDFQEGLDYIEANQVPEEYGTYEFLRDLAFRVIESAELVTVEWTHLRY